MAESMRRAFAVRNEVLGDPDQVTFDQAMLTSPAFITAMFATISIDRATPSSQVTGPRRARGEPSDDSLFSDRSLRERGGAHDNDQRLVRIRGHGDGRRFSPQQRDGRLRGEAGLAEHVRPRPGRSERHRAQQADALGDDADDRARRRPHAAARDRRERRPVHHHHGVPGDLQSARLRPRRVGADAGPAHAPSAPAGRAAAREGRLRGRGRRRAAAPGARRVSVRGRWQYRRDDRAEEQPLVRPVGPADLGACEGVRRAG